MSVRPLAGGLEGYKLYAQELPWQNKLKAFIENYTNLLIKEEVNNSTGRASDMDKIINTGIGG